MTEMKFYTIGALLGVYLLGVFVAFVTILTIELVKWFKNEESGDTYTVEDLIELVPIALLSWASMVFIIISALVWLFEEKFKDFKKAVIFKRKKDE